MVINFNVNIMVLEDIVFMLQSLENLRAKNVSRKRECHSVINVNHNIQYDRDKILHNSASPGSLASVKYIFFCK